MDKLKEWFGVGRPGGWDDVLVRAAKLAVYTFLGLVLKHGVEGADWTFYKQAIDAAWVAGFGLIANSVYYWSGKE